jgi:magnesium transporter
MCPLKSFLFPTNQRNPMKTPISDISRRGCMVAAQHTNGSDPNHFKARCFCATLMKKGTQSARSEDLQEFSPLIEKASVAWVDYIAEDVKTDAISAATGLGFSETLVASLLQNARTGYEDYENEMGLLLPAIHVKGFDATINPLLILIKKDLILTIHTREIRRFVNIRRYAETFFKKLPKDMPQNDRLTSVLIRIIDENNSKNFEYLQEIEENGDALSRDLSNSKMERIPLGERIYQMKHALIVYLGGLWATSEALSSLRYGDAELMSDDPRLLDKINGLLNEVHGQIGLAEHLSEVLASGLEVLQSIYNNQLQIINNRLSFLMGILTIIGTALLVPNTIATVMSQTNIFAFTPADMGWYLALLVGSTVVATIFAWWAVKKLGFLPKHPDEE